MGGVRLSLGWRWSGNEDMVLLEKVLVTLLNSTPGKLGMLLIRSNKIPSYPHFSTDGWRRIPIPKLDTLTDKQIQDLAGLYDELAHRERQSFPNAHLCDVQLQLDESVCSSLNFDTAICKKMRHMLAQEPMITGQHYEFS